MLDVTYTPAAMFHININYLTILVGQYVTQVCLFVISNTFSLPK